MNDLSAATASTAVEVMLQDLILLLRNVGNDNKCSLRCSLEDPYFCKLFKRTPRMAVVLAQLLAARFAHCRQERVC